RRRAERHRVQADLEPRLARDPHRAVGERGEGAGGEQRDGEHRAAALIRLRGGRGHRAPMLASVHVMKRTGTLIAVVFACLVVAPAAPAGAQATTAPTATTGVPPGTTPQPAPSAKPAPSVSDNAVQTASKSRSSDAGIPAPLVALAVIGGLMA